MPSPSLPNFAARLWRALMLRPLMLRPPVLRPLMLRPLMLRPLMLCLVAGLPALAAAADPLPIADTHVHYSHDAWETIPVPEVIGLMRKAGLRFAMVSSSSDEGTQRLYQAAPELVVPSLRPYRSRGEISTWVRDESVVRHVEDRLRRFRYAAIGEFHVYGADADLPVPRRMVELARQHNLILHAHSDADAIERLFVQFPQARVLWAHAGFDRPANVRALLRKHPGLRADLAFRSDHGNGGKVDPEWREAFVEFPDRFMVGTDTFTPERLHYIPEHANWSRAWLADLPAPLAERIAWRNAQELILPVWQANRSGSAASSACGPGSAANRAAAQQLDADQAVLSFVTTPAKIAVGQRFSVLAQVCPRHAGASIEALNVDATMPEHRHGMNYTPRISRAGAQQFRADGLLLHMPGRWQMSFDLRIDGRTERLVHELVLR
ncbi:MAG TPA: hypothetical protein PK359_11295 [Burkholderiaceae bacterium]|nr:hypothetical protein [Burkholderiaceae bacterium]